QVPSERTSWNHEPIVSGGNSKSQRLGIAPLYSIKGTNGLHPRRLRYTCELAPTLSFNRTSTSYPTCPFRPTPQPWWGGRGIHASPTQPPSTAMICPGKHLLPGSARGYRAECLGRAWIDQPCSLRAPIQHASVAIRHAKRPRYCVGEEFLF